MADPLDTILVRLRSIPEQARALLPEVAAEVKSAIGANIAAERGPDGTPWPRTNDGRHALKGALKAVTVQVVGGTVLVTVDGIEAKHHLGVARGRVRRAIVPESGIPSTIAEAIQRVVARRLR